MLFSSLLPRFVAKILCTDWLPDRAGTQVLPGYQKMGFGQYLTRYCNEIADKSGCRTWIPATPNAASMFKKLDFKEVGILDTHMERYGFDAAVGKMYILLRDAPISGKE